MNCEVGEIDTVAYLRVGLEGLGGKDGNLSAFDSCIETSFGRLSSLGWGALLVSGWRTVLSQTLKGGD